MMNIRLTRSLGAGLLCVLVAGSAARSATLEKFDLRPPSIAVKPICVVKERVEDLRKRWAGFEAIVPGKAEPGELRAVAQRLASFDAKNNFDVAEKLLRHLMRGKDPGVAAHAGADLVKLHVEASRLNRDNAREFLPLIETGTLAGSPNNLYLSGLIHEQGQAVPRDMGLAFARYRAAAVSGNPDALLKLVKLKIAGYSEAGDVDVAATMTLAINAILKDDSPAVCENIKRIARLFSKGDYIEPNHEATASWLRLAADFGDADAAWSLARMHLRSELIVKDNAVLVKYLTLAAEGGVTQAMLELAAINADGSLVDANSEKAEYWFNKAAATGSVQALARLAEFYQRSDAPLASRKAEDILRLIVKSPEAPAHTLTQLGKIEIETKGNADGGSAARPLLERAAALGDPEARLMLARMNIAAISDPASFREVANELEDAAANGSSDAMRELAKLYMCHNPSGPDSTRARQWTEAALGAGNGHLLIEEVLAAQSGKRDASRDMALFRSLALSGTSDAVAYVVDGYDRQEAGSVAATDKPKWAARLQSDAGAMWRYAKIVAARSGDGQARPFLEMAAASGSVTAEIDLAKLPGMGARAEGLLMATARKGRGEAMELLIKRWGGARFRKFYDSEGLARAVRDRGDYRAHLIAAGTAQSPEQRRAGLAMAAAALDCSFDSTFRMAEAAQGLGDRQTAVRWAAIAADLAGNGGSNNFRLARFYGGIDSGEFAGTIAALLGRAADAGHPGAVRELLDVVASKGSFAYDPKRALRLADKLRQGGDAKSQYAAARALRAISEKSPEAAASAGDLLRRAAEQGHAPAMRDYGITLMRGEGGTAGVIWLQRAADLDDATAMVELARAYAIGTGVDASMPKATELLDKAAALGNADAVSLLHTLASM